MDSALTAAMLALVRKDGLRTIAKLDAAPGLYQVRTVVREGDERKPGDINRNG
jgi:hypothetical protein